MAKVKYQRCGAGHYDVYVNGDYTGYIERTGDGDGWADAWWWTWGDPAIKGLLTASSLRALKEMLEPRIVPTT